VIDSSSTFRVTTRPERDRVVVAAHGEIDLATVSVLDTEVQDLRARGFREIVLDLRAVTFMDSTGVRLLLQLDAESRSDGFSFEILDADGPVRRVLTLTGVNARLARFGAVEAETSEVLKVFADEGFRHVDGIAEGFVRFHESRPHDAARGGIELPEPH